MGNFNKILLSGAMAALVGSSAMATPVGPRNFDISKHTWRTPKASAMKAFSEKRMKQVQHNNALMMRRANANSAGIAPNITFESSNGIGDIDGPNGKLWFYTSEMVNKIIPHEYYDEVVLLEYTFHIFDENARPVGTIHDKVRYEDYEVRAVECSLVPFISKNFFNDDDKYEVLIGLGLNRKDTKDGEDVWMSNAYRNIVYSLDGEKETLSVETPEGTFVEKEFCKPVYRIEGSLGDVLDASTANEERFFLTMYDESLPEYDDDDIEGGEGGPTVTEGFWDKLCAAHITMKVCGKVDSEGKMPEMMKFDIPILSMPGDQENTPFLISRGLGEDSYYMVQYYKDVFYNPYQSATDDMTMREHNSLVVDLYHVSGSKLVKTSSTEIPFVKDSKDRLLFSFHSVGDFRYAEDINFDKDGNPSFFVTKNNYFADEHSEYSYYHYDKGGKKLNDIFQNAESKMEMSTVEGLNPQEMFVTYGNGEYRFHFVDLLTGKELVNMSCYLELDPDSDPEMLTSNVDRTKAGDSYEYAFEMKMPTIDENNNTINRFAWFDKDGNFLRIEEVNMGQNVMYAMTYLDAHTLQRDMFLSDDAREYMMLIKRAVDSETLREDLLIAQALNPEAPEGKDVLLVIPDERGAISTINPYTMLENPMLHIYFYDQNTGNVALDIYNLPFAPAAVKEIEAAGSEAELTYDGTTLCAQGAVKVYSMQGALVKTGIDTVSVAGLESGLYIATSGENVRKFMVK